VTRFVLLYCEMIHFLLDVVELFHAMQRVD
jgi:hypothetical protein